MKRHHSRIERWGRAAGGIVLVTTPSERILDAAIECTFPASDPIAVHHAFENACARERVSADPP